jgi:DNA-binding Lrp family transcriptional regulator
MTANLLDDLDHRLIALLRADARMPVSALAHRLQVARGTVSNRIARLERDGIIDGYTVRLRPDARPAQISAWTGILVDGNETRAVVASLLGEPCVAALHDTNGRWDLLAELRADDLAHLSRALERIRLIRGIKHSETSIHLATYRG